MREYKSLAEAKKHLPEILDRLKLCRRLYRSCGLLLQDIEKCCLEEMEDRSVNYGAWSSMETYEMIARNQMRYLSEILYLDALKESVARLQDL